MSRPLGSPKAQTLNSYVSTLLAGTWPNFATPAKIKKQRNTPTVVCEGDRGWWLSPPPKDDNDLRPGPCNVVPFGVWYGFLVWALIRTAQTGTTLEGLGSLPSVASGLPGSRQGRAPRGFLGDFKDLAFCGQPQGRAWQGPQERAQCRVLRRSGSPKP